VANLRGLGVQGFWTTTPLPPKQNQKKEYRITKFYEIYACKITAAIQ